VSSHQLGQLKTTYEGTEITEKKDWRGNAQFHVVNLSAIGHSPKGINIPSLLSFSVHSVISVAKLFSPSAFHGGLCGFALKHPRDARGRPRFENAA